MKGERGDGESSVVPEAVMEAAKRSSANVEELRVHMDDFLAVADVDVVAEMPPLARAQALFVLAKAASTLVTLRLRCDGIHPDDHPIKTELERLRLYQEKLDRSVALSKAPLRQSTKLNYQAATRFIEHSLPDLTTEQKQSMRDISRGKASSWSLDRENGKKKRKCQTNEKQSVRAAAEEFLQKAARELFGSNNGDMKGPLQMGTEDGEDVLMD